MRPPKTSRRQLLRGLAATAPLCALGGASTREAARLRAGLDLQMPRPDASVLAAPPPHAPGAFGGWAPPTGDPIQLDLPQLRYPGNWSPRPGAMRVLARELRLRTRLEPVSEPTTVAAGERALFETPFLYIAGEGELPDQGEEVEQNLRRFIDFGGLILFDAADGGADLAFTRSVRALLERIMPGSELAPVSSEHVIYRSFYLVDFPWGRTQVHDTLLAVQEEGRLKVVLTRNDLGGALAETDSGLAAYPCSPGGSDQREWAMRFGVNILLYATCTDYKADRAHVETLLRSRRWK